MDACHNLTTSKHIHINLTRLEPACLATSRISRCKRAIMAQRLPCCEAGQLRVPTCTKDRISRPRNRLNCLTRTGRTIRRLHVRMDTCLKDIRTRMGRATHTTVWRRPEEYRTRAMGLIQAEPSLQHLLFLTRSASLRRATVPIDLRLLQATRWHTATRLRHRLLQRCRRPDLPRR